jgi:hypothetical protein
MIRMGLERTRIGRGSASAGWGRTARSRPRRVFGNNEWQEAFRQPFYRFPYLVGIYILPLGLCCHTLFWPSGPLLLPRNLSSSFMRCCGLSALKRTRGYSRQSSARQVTCRADARIERKIAGGVVLDKCIGAKLFSVIPSLCSIGSFLGMNLSSCN